ncbi:MAG: hypothetical protein WDM85_17925 [Caulobacteraceae bacterium]
MIAAGGLASVTDIERLRDRSGTPIAGAVLGRALYVGAIQPGEALAAAADAENPPCLRLGSSPAST